MHERSYQSAKNYIVLFALLILVLITLLLRAAQPTKIVDDAYITLRYARNLANGFGLVYNPGEWVLGTTTPLHAIILGWLYWLLPKAWPLPVVVVWVNAIYDTISVCVVAMLFARVSRSWVLGLCSAAGLAVLPHLVDYASSGMETSLYVMLIWLTALLLAHKRFATAGITAVLAALTRPEAVILVGLVALVILLSRNTAVMSVPQSLLPMLALLLAWLAATFYVYGSPLPQSAATKLGGRVYELAGDETYWMLLQTQRNLVPWLTFEAHNKIEAWQASIPAVLLWLAGVAVLVWRDWRPGVLPVFTIAFAIGVSISNPVPNWWHLATFAALAFPVVIVGACGLLRIGYGLLRLQVWQQRPRAATLTHFGLMTLVTVGSIAASGYLIYPQLARYNGKDLVEQYSLAYCATVPLSHCASALQLKPSYDPQRERDYLIVADTLDKMRVGNARVASSEIGALGYGYRGPILDTIGLVSPISTRYYPIPKDELLTNNAIPRQLIREQQPEFVMSLDVFIANSVLKDDAFLQRYQPVFRGSSDIFGSHSLLLYARQDFAERWQVDKLPVMAKFGDGIRLHNTVIEPRTAYGSNTVNIGLLWSENGLNNNVIGNDYKVFIHALDASGKRVAQTDALPNPPSTLWAQNVLYLDWHPITLPANINTRDVRFLVGLYHSDTGQRLPLSGVAEGQGVDNGVMIGVGQ